MILGDGFKDGGEHWLWMFTKEGLCEESCLHSPLAKLIVGGDRAENRQSISPGGSVY